MFPRTRKHTKRSQTAEPASIFVERLEVKSLLSGVSGADATAAVSAAEAGLTDARKALANTEHQVQTNVDAARQTAQQEKKEAKAAKNRMQGEIITLRSNSSRALRPSVKKSLP